MVMKNKISITVDFALISEISDNDMYAIFEDAYSVPH